MTDEKKQVTEIIDNFIEQLNEGSWNEELYNMIKEHIIDKSSRYKNSIPTQIAYKYYCFGETVSFLKACNSNPNDIYTINNLTDDDFYDRQAKVCMLINIAFGIHSIDDYPSLE